MSNRNLIIIGFVILFLPVSYYFLIALPNHNNVLQQIEIDKLEYQKEQDSLREKKEQEERDRIQEERREMEEKYNNCVKKAENEKIDMLKGFCEAEKTNCRREVDRYNAWFSEWTDPIYLKNYWQCPKDCLIDSNSLDLVNKDYQRKIDSCNKNFW